MDIREIASLADLKKIAGKQERTFLLLFRGGTEKSDCALNALNELDGKVVEDIIFLKADVSSVRDIHTEYGIESVPALLEFRSGRQKNITVYSTPTCTWCNTLKSYLKERKIPFRDIDVSVDQKAAEQMVNKSGQQGVPQTDIDGQIIVGFDKKRMDSLLELGK